MAYENSVWMMKRILCYGDSNTYGYDPQSFLGERYPETIRWTGRLRQAGWDIMNEGQNGREIPTRDWEKKLAVKIMKSAFPLDIVIIMLGGNDLLQNHGFSADDVSERMKTFLNEFLPQLPDCCCILTAPPPMRPGAWVSEQRLLHESARLASCYGELACSLGIDFADAGQWDIELAYDGVHFSEAGHEAFAEGLLRYLSQKGYSERK